MTIDEKVGQLFLAQIAVNSAPTPKAFNVAARKRDDLKDRLSAEDCDRAAFVARAVLRLVGHL